MQLKDLVREIDKLDGVTKLTESEYNLLELAYLFDDEDISNDEMLTEGKILDMLKGKLDGIAGKLKDLGFEFHNTKPGLIQVLAKGGKTVVKAFLLGLAATKAKALNDQTKLDAVKTEAKVIANDVQTAFSQKNVVDILMQLDQATAHLVTGPIHMFNALTGIHVVLPWESKTPHGGDSHGEHGSIKDVISASIKSLKDKISKVLQPDKASEAHIALDRVNAMAAAG